MSKKTWLLGVTVLALAGGAVLVHSNWSAERAVARQPSRADRPVPVEVAKAVRKRVPIQIEALGTVTPIASVALKTRVDTTITGVHFKDGAHVDKGELLFTLDCRVIEAQIAQTEGSVARDKAQLAGAMRDVARYTSLVAKQATPTVNLDNAKTQADVYRAAIKSDQGSLENLQVQRSFCDVKAPIAGRISAANVKVGNFVRQADTTPMATINQMAPVYVSFTVSQKNLPALRKALNAKTARIEAFIPGAQNPETGDVSMIENTVDPATGMATVRATMPNADEGLWPGTLVSVDLTLRSEDAVVVPSNAVQVSQAGSIVFVVEKNAAKVRHVTVQRQVGDNSVVTAGLKPGETVVTEGQVRLRNGSHVTTHGRGGPRKPPSAGS
ncbi:MAG TPA: efflux RND transporter periplasmic adaptor subunit [Pseudolabrys sp.]|nr:efflux RND transporter periplasmic adaptor subunit [Pseudolabrys sp.]